MIRSLSLCSLALLAWPVLVQAATPVNLRSRTAGELATLCSANPRDAGSDAKINYCHGYAQGAITVELSHAGEKKPFCFPNPAPTRAQTLKDFVAWVRAEPARRDLGASEGLFQFLGERYPCK
ncbi:MAG TPA: Rap1a/Tai family immunity protein [Acetobacteraceae bacterium]|nr:Rap1a/Tai family immunity protein [Acetobacteraceae bacterium]